MTYDLNAEDEGVRVPQLKLRIEDPKGDYVILKEAEAGNGIGFDDNGAGASCSTTITCSRWWSLWWWAKLILLLTFLGVLAAVFFKWIGPFFMDKVQFCILIVFMHVSLGCI